VVAAQHRVAAEAGARVLEHGGDAIDAAVATSFALGVVEPWMSGIAAGGCMVAWRADEGRAHAIDYGMRAPAALDPADYPLAGTGKASDLFPWDAVVGDRNVQGATAIAVPGVVAGMGSRTSASAGFRGATSSCRRSSWPSKACGSTGTRAC
jgi:gamma-glutamyltranspeptidase/glutathione hydrolase